MDCEKYLEIMSAMIDGEVSEDEQKELMLHIKNCKACKSAYDAFTAISAELSELVEAPENLCKNVMSEVKKTKKRPRPHFIRYGAIAACFALVAYVGMDSISMQSDSADTAMATAEMAVTQRSIVTEESGAADMAEPKQTAVKVEQIEVRQDGEEKIIVEEEQIIELLGLLRIQEVSPCENYDIIANLSVEGLGELDIVKTDEDVYCIRDNKAYLPVGTMDEIMTAIG